MLALDNKREAEKWVPFPVHHPIVHPTGLAQVSVLLCRGIGEWEAYRAADPFALESQPVPSDACWGSTTTLPGLLSTKISKHEICQHGNRCRWQADRTSDSCSLHFWWLEWFRGGSFRQFCKCPCYSTQFTVTESFVSKILRVREVWIPIPPLPAPSCRIIKSHSWYVH